MFPAIFQYFVEQRIYVHFHQLVDFDYFVEQQIYVHLIELIDYFDFDFRANVSEKKEESSVLKMSEEVKVEAVEEAVNFDNEANRIIMVARLGSLFGCDKKMINA